MNFELATKVFALMTLDEQEHVLVAFVLSFKRSGATWTPQRAFEDAVLYVINKKQSPKERSLP